MSLKGFQAKIQDTPQAMIRDIDTEQFFSRIYEDYDRYFIIPVAMLLVALAVLTGSFLLNDQVFEKGTDFEGGNQVIYNVENGTSEKEVSQAFIDYEQADWQPQDVSVRTQVGSPNIISVRTPPPIIESNSQAEQILTGAGTDAEVDQLISLSGILGQEFLFQAQIAFVLAFTIMSLVIFTAFRDFIPAVAVVFAATGDIMMAATGMVVFGIPLTLGSVAALLMLIGYSVDTDIVLSTRVLKQQRGSLKERIWSSVKTGVTMSSGGIAGFTLLYIVSNLIVGPSELSNIAAVMVIGLLADMPLTWFGNAAILKM
ncbi:MAG: hypothetical protein BRC30_01135, partial [Nanohaloarchaea archaeon SW_7_46_7]